MSKQPPVPTFDKSKAIIIMPASLERHSTVSSIKVSGKVICIQPVGASAIEPKAVKKTRRKTG